MTMINLAQAMVDRSLLVPTTDDAIFTSHWRVAVPGGPDTEPMTHTHRSTATDMLKTFWEAIGAHISNKCALREVRWYELADSAPHKAVFVEAIAVSPPAGDLGGSSGAPFPPQVAISVTFKTDQRKSWGRFYVPGPTLPGSDTTSGVIASSECDLIAAAAVALCSRATTGQSHPTLTVWSPTEGTHHDPQYVQVDNLYDVQRSRRYKKATYKKQLAAGG